MGSPLQWPCNDEEKANALTIDGSGNVYVTGYSYTPATAYDYATVKYNSDGIQQWAARYDGPRNNYEEAIALAVGHTGNIFVTGYSLGSATFYDYATIKYNADGGEQWVTRYNGPGNDADIPAALAIVSDSASGEEAIYIAGYSSGDTWHTYTTIKYIQSSTVSLEESPDALPTGFSLAQNYPNPFNSATIIEYTLVGRSHVTLKVYNILGEEIITLAKGEQPAGKHAVKWNPENTLSSGIYFYCLSVRPLLAGDKKRFSAAKKLLLLR